MKITLLCENQVGYRNHRVCLAEWGLSVYIQVYGVNILFDTGSTDIYWRNAEKLKINLQNVDFIVLSHYHWDHTGGLRYHNFKTKKKIIMHPEILKKLSKDESKKIKDNFTVVTSKEPLEITKNVYFLGQIPRKSKFERGRVKSDKMYDDTALAIKSNKGLIIATGCSHSGICNICEYSKIITGQDIYAIIGGFHLYEDDQKAVEGTIKYFKKENPKYLYPMHCVDFPTLSRFYSEFKITKKSSGDVISF